MQIDFSYASNHIQLDLSAPCTVVEGESASGKTFIFKALQAANRYALRGQQLQDQDTNWARDFSFLNSLSTSKEIFHVCADVHGIIVMDNVNYLFYNYPDLKNKLANSLGEDRYLLFGRSPLGIDSQGVCFKELKYENHLFSLV